jgi:sterol desaturase/sphingolipid hydroxylase (fatty acid hydroxylase superfamily)
VDRLFGTYHEPKAQWPSRYGTETPVPAGLAGQLIDPLMPQTEPVPQSTVPSSL